MVTKKTVSLALAVCMVLSILSMGTVAVEVKGPSLPDGVYIIADENSSGTMISGECPSDAKSYGFLYDDHTAQEQHERCQYYFTHKGNGMYTITDHYGRYMGVSGSYKSFQLYTANVGDPCLWTITSAANGKYVVKNVSNGATIDYSIDFSSFGVYPSAAIPVDGQIYLISMAGCNNAHAFQNGICSRCDDYEPAVLKGNAYEISNAGQLYWFAAQVNGGNTSISGKLTADITVNANVVTAAGQLNNGNWRSWTPIGGETVYYEGTFDGNGKTVSGLYYDDTATDYVGLFGYVGKNGAVKNVGILASYLRCDSKFDNGGDCDPGEVPDSGYDFVGGVVGYNAGTVSGCCNTGAVIVNNPNTRAYNLCAGGVVGCNTGTVSGCYHSGIVSGTHTQSSIGGVVGTNWNIVTNCYNIGAVGGNNRVGGVAGSFYDGTVSNCHNTGTISGNSLGFDMGGIIGLYDSGSVINCYYLAGCVTNGNFRGTSKSAAAFSSGEVCFLLQGQQEKQIWGQKIGKDSHPVFSADQVYSSNGSYSNQPTASTFAISGSITSYLGSGKVTVELLQNDSVVAVTVISGTTYRFENVAKGTYTLRFSKENHIARTCEITVGKDTAAADMTICPVGDVTGDGVVNIKDFQRLLRHVNKTNPLVGYALSCGDVTGDGVCNIKDFQRLLRHVNKTNPLF